MPAEFVVIMCRLYKMRAVRRNLYFTFFVQSTVCMILRTTTVDKKFMLKLVGVVGTIIGTSS